MTGMSQLKSRLLFWIGASRAPFFVAVITPTVLGTAIAWAAQGIFHWYYFLLTLLGVMMVNGGTNLVNDYYDHKSSNDEINKEFVFPFTGGSRMIQQGLLKPSQVLKAGITCFAIAIIIGLYLTWTRGPVVLILGLIGVLTGYFYTTPPLKLGYRWTGEFIVGLDCGILVTLGAYYVQTQSLTLQAGLAAIPLALLIIAVIWVNEIPDYPADRAAGKMQLVARLGRPRAATGYVVIVLANYVIIVFSVLFRWIDPTAAIPPLALLGLLTLPLATKSIKTALKFYSDSRLLAPANATTPQLYLFTGLLLSLGFALNRVFLG